MTDLPIQLPWSWDGRQWFSDTLYGKAKIVPGTFPPVTMQLSRDLVGHTIYFKGKRVGWTVDAASAGQVASQVVTAAMRERTQGRTS